MYKELLKTEKEKEQNSTEKKNPPSSPQKSRHVKEKEGQISLKDMGEMLNLTIRN